MKKIMIAALGLSVLTGTFAFAQNTSTGSTDTSSMKSTKKSHKKAKKSTGTATSTSTM